MSAAGHIRRAQREGEVAVVLPGEAEVGPLLKAVASEPALKAHTDT